MTYLLLVLIFILSIAGHVLFTRRKARQQYEKKQRLTQEHEALVEEEVRVSKDVGLWETEIARQFLVYDLIRKIDPILDRQQLFDVFISELKRLSPIAAVEIGPASSQAGWLEFKLKETAGGSLRVKTQSRQIIGQFRHLAEILDLCLERIALYERLQRLSIYDSLTEIHNRRYFMMRYKEEFNRAKDYKLNLSFLMIDIDHFKKVNDTYGHLVGDVLLKEVARLIKESIREIDFVGRLGGEEFGVVLSDTDKTGAIMAAERICSRVAAEKVRAFDELVSSSVSVGVACYPQNTLYCEALVETADKALYKAKVSGRNRTSWF